VDVDLRDSRAGETRPGARVPLRVRSRPEPMRKAARRIRNHFERILKAIVSRATNAAGTGVQPPSTAVASISIPRRPESPAQNRGTPPALDHQLPALSRDSHEGRCLGQAGPHGPEIGSSRAQGAAGVFRLPAPQRAPLETPRRTARQRESSRIITASPDRLELRPRHPRPGQDERESARALDQAPQEGSGAEEQAAVEGRDQGEACPQHQATGALAPRSPGGPSTDARMRWHPGPCAVRSPRRAR
jgi:hypothetical protein